MIFYSLSLLWKAFHKKDSAVCIALTERAGIPFEAMHNHTTVDAPETVRFVREDFRRLEEKGVKCTINFPVYKGQRVTMWSLIPQKLMPPTRIARYLLLFNPKRARRKWPLYNNGGTLGGVPKAERKLGNL